MNIEEIFHEFIQVVKENDNYTIGLLNDKGYIIYSSDEKIKKHRVNITDLDRDSLLYSMEIKEDNIAYLWIHSEDMNKKIVGNLIAESLRTRIVYEKSLLATQESVSVNEQLINLMLSETKESAEKFITLSHKNKYKANNEKVVIIVKDNLEKLDNNGLARLKFLTEKYHAIFSKKTDGLIMLLDLSSQSYYKEIEQFITELQKWGLNCSRYFVGSIQNQMHSYKFSYDTAEWLSHINPMESDIAYFTSYLFDYALYELSINFDKNLFVEFDINLSEDFKEEFIEIVETLCTHDFNISKTAEALYLHKNTLLYRLNKFEDMLGVNFKAGFQGKVILYMLARHLKKLMN